MRLTLIVLPLAIGLVAGCSGDTSTPRSGAPTAPAAAALASSSQFVDQLDRSSSLAGVDANKDGIRDDINRWLETQTFTELQKKAVINLARSSQQTLLVDTQDKTAVRAAAQKDAVAMDCLYATFDPKSSRPREIVSQVEAMTANTQERTTQYIRYNEALGGMAFELTPTTACE